MLPSPDAIKIPPFNNEPGRPVSSSAAQAVRTFRQIHACVPEFVVTAPGRVNLIGEHTDYNDGFALPMAIDRKTVMVAGRSKERTVTLHSLTNGESASFSLRGPIQTGTPAWTNYVRGVIAGFQRLGIDQPGFTAVINSTVPPGGGLSSSAALEVATATLLETMTGERLDPEQKALLCQRAEHEFAGVPCGIMDQFVSVMGKKDCLLLLDCRSRRTELVPMAAPEVTILIINSHVRHELANGEYARRRVQCEMAARELGIAALRDASLAQLDLSSRKLAPVVFRRARHVISENERTLEAAGRIGRRDWKKVGELMYASHASLREDYEVSCPELDAIVQSAQDIGLAGGVYGCRMTGGGFGGCAVCLVRTDTAPEVARTVQASYESKIHRVATVFVSRPAEGASILFGPERTKG